MEMQSRSITSLAVLLTGLAACGALADTGQTENILVTATRLDPFNSRARGNTSIITAADIENSTARTLPELLGREAGVLTRSLYGNHGTAATVDIRGFGAASTQNTLILLDGRRLNDVDLSSVDFSVIPLQGIERIEITRNSGAVLYGDGAVGGTINIITRQPDKAGTSGFIQAGAGNLDTRQLDAHVSHTTGPLSMFLGAHGISSDGYRDHNDLDEKSISSDIRFTTASNELFLKLNWNDQDLDLPGVRAVNPGASPPVDELKTDRRGSGTPNDYADQDGYSINPGFTHYWDNGAEAIIDFGYRKKNQQAFFDAYQAFDVQNYLDSELTTWSFTPRIITPHRLFGRQSQTTVGIDYYDSDYDSDRSQNKSTRGLPIHRLHIDQKSTGIYADSVIAAGSDITVNLGARLQWVKLDARDRFDPTAPGAAAAFESGAPDFDDSQRVHMLEAGIEKQFNPATAGFIKWTRSARVTTVDELFEFDPNTFVRVFSPLDPQTANGVDIGTRYRQGGLSANATVYYMRLKDEIHFSPVTFENVNLDPTERYGLELSGRLAVSDRLSLQGDYSLLRSRFRDGPFAGNTVPLVPEHTAALTATWKQSAATDLSITATYIDNRYFDNDQGNTFTKRIPSYKTVDAKLGHTHDDYRFTASVNNIFNEKAIDYGVSSNSSPGVYNAYPLPERTLLFTVAKSFGGQQ